MNAIAMLQTASVHTFPYLPRPSSKPKQHQKTKGNKRRQYDAIPPLLTANPAHQHINPGHLTRRANNPPINTSERLPLRAELVIDCIRLCEHGVCHAVAVFYARSFPQHVLCFGVRRVLAAVGLDVFADVAEQV
jgi:hypothetical protein